MEILPATSVFGTFLEHSFWNCLSFPQHLHSLPLAGQSALRWNESDLQFQHPLGGGGLLVGPVVGLADVIGVMCGRLILRPACCFV